MIIKRIELENFTCYSGTNTFEFQEGVNIIIGDNGYGKSQLFDAFYWVINNQIFMSKECRSTKEVRSAIISDKALSETGSGTISAVVRITFHEQRSDQIYILERKYSVRKDEDQIIEASDSEFSLYKKDLSILAAKLVTEESDKKSIISRILPADKKEYLWFQGEQVDKIIDFQQSDTLTRAIKVLSDINTYDELSKIANQLSETAQSEYDKELKRLSKDKKRSDELEAAKSEIQRKILNLNVEEVDLRDNLDRADSRFDELINKLEEAESIRDAQNAKKALLKEIESINSLYVTELTRFNRKLIREKWVIKGTEQIQVDFEQKFNEYTSKKLEYDLQVKVQQKINEGSMKIILPRLPKDVPEPIYIKKMLDEERCLVCDREAPKHSEAWLKMKELIEQVSKDKGAPKGAAESKHNFGTELRNLYNTGLVLSRRIVEIDTDISDALQKISDLETLLQLKKKEINEKETEIISLTTKHSLQEDDAINIISEVQVQKELSQRYSERLAEVLQQLAACKNRIARIDEELEGLITTEVAKHIIDKKNVLSDFEIVARNTRVRVFENLINRLEQEANEHYYEMTSNNMAFQGRIKLLKRLNNNYMPAIVDEGGRVLHGLNTSNLTMVKLSVIMAIISANYKDLGGDEENGIDLYTLISDAPTSVFGAAYTLGFCKTVSKVYRQSIIMSKDFYNNEPLRMELLSDSEINVGNVYVIRPSILESERTDRSKLSTIIEKIN